MLLTARKRVVGAASALTVAVSAILVGATIAWAATGPVEHHVSAGGPDACIALGGEHPGCDANYSLVATQYADGSVSGQYTDRFAGGDGFHAVVDCLVVIGNDAWISGVITQGRIGDIELAGLEVLTRVRDNGTSANDPPDQISFSFIDTELPDCTEQPDLPLLDTPEGQVTIQ
jgi:hypothetical protein